ncbi:MAG: DUF2520 domain-containing protein [bacterium]|nr:DUF2520 domain-containing protein [bacterium]
MAKSRFYLVGPGAVGKVLARRLVRSGWTCSGVCGRGSAVGRRLAKELGAPYVSTLEGIQFVGGTLILAVGTGQVAALAKELSHLNLPWSRIAVLHNSGTLDASPLLPLAKLGATVGACHPFMTFPRFSGSVRAGLKEDLYNPTFPFFFGIDGNRAGLAAARKVVKACWGLSLVVRGQDRIAYHAAAVMACTLLGANIAMASEILQKVGISEKAAQSAVLAIARETLSNFSEYGIDRSWTGPAIRGDRKTIAAHTKAIAKLNPETAKVYRLLSGWVMKQQSSSSPGRD